MAGFMSIYFSHPVTTNSETVETNSYERPAISICNMNFIRRSILCKWWKNINNETELCRRFPTYCPDNKKPFLRTCEYRPDNSEWTEEVWERLKSSSASNNMIISCFETSGNIRKPCKTPYTPIPAFHRNGFGRFAFCYVINSVKNDRIYKEHHVPNNFQLSLTLGVEPDEYEEGNIYPSAFISLHDPLKLVNPYMGGTLLKSGYKYKASINSVFERISLPSPYETNCLDYRSMWRKNNGSGPMTTQACIETCFKEDTLRKYDCVPKDIAFPHTEKLCGQYEQIGDIPADVVNKCSEKCHMPCLYANLTLEISFKDNRIQVKRTIDTPKIEPMKLYSITGGYLVLWSGLCFIDFVDFCKRFYRFAKYTYNSKEKKNSFTFRKSDLNSVKREDSVFQWCYITSFADVSSSKSTKEKFLKASVFFFCVCGLLWQSISLMNAYWSYSTVRKEITSSPLLFFVPAVTVCDSMMRPHTVMCKQNPYKCSFLDEATLCREYFRICNSSKTRYPISMGDYRCRNDCPSWTDLYQLQDRDMKRKGYQGLPFTTNEGDSRLCYTYGMRANQAEDYHKMSPFTNWNLRYPVTLFNHLYAWESAHLYLAIHDARRKVNPFREGVKLDFASNYRIFVNEGVETTLLPPPYDTNCTDYFTEWRKNNETGPLTTLECIDHCQLSEYLKDKDCAPRLLRKSHQVQLCNESETIPQDVLQHCIDQCGTVKSETTSMKSKTHRFIFQIFIMALE